jgi:hypothetical protein
MRHTSIYAFDEEVNGFTETTEAVKDFSAKQ